jgi:hypothetical protein
MMCDMTLAELMAYERLVTPLVRLAQITNCPVHIAVIPWLLERGLVVSFDGKTYVPTERGRELIELDLVENPPR